MYRDASRVSARGFRNFSLQWFGGCGGGDDDDDDDDDDARMRRRDANARATLVATVIGASSRDAGATAGGAAPTRARVGKKPVTSTERVYFFRGAADLASSYYNGVVAQLVERALRRPHEFARGTEMYVCSTTIRRRRETRPSTVAWNNPLTEAHVLPHSETWRLQWRLKFLFSFLLVGR